MQKLTISLPDSIAALLFAAVDKGKRSDFIAQAIQTAVEREQAQKAINAIYQFHPLPPQEPATTLIRHLRERHSKA